MEYIEYVDCGGIKQEITYNSDNENSLPLVENCANNESESLYIPTTHNVSKFEKPKNDDEKLKLFLRYIDMEDVYKYLKASQVTFRSLQYLRNEDFKEAIPPLGLRVEFREKLSQWKKNELATDDENSSMPSTVGDWLQTTSSDFMEHTTSYSRGSRVLHQELRSLLCETLKGRSLIEYSQQHGDLTMSHRYTIVDTIIEDIIFHNTVLRPPDFMKIFEEICNVFPHEKRMQDYYYVPRKGKNNASGRLYAKYKNTVSKRRKNMSSESNTENNMEKAKKPKTIVKDDEDNAHDQS